MHQPVGGRQALSLAIIQLMRMEGINLRDAEVGNDQIANMVESVPPLLEAFAPNFGDLDRRVRRRAINLVHRIIRRGRMALEELSRRDASRAETLRGPYRIRLREFSSALRPCIHDLDARNRMRVAIVLSELAGPEAIAGLIELLRDSDWEVREQAALGIWLLALDRRTLQGQRRETERALMARQTDPNPMVRNAATLALEEMRR